MEERKLMYIKESYVYEFQEMHCHSAGCGYWRAPDNDHSMGRHKPLRMFKVNGEYMCEGCMRDNANEMLAWLNPEKGYLVVEEE